MKFSIILLGAALYLFSSVEAGISTTNPFKSITWNGGETKTITWTDDGKAPKLQDIGQTTVELMVGGPENQLLADTIGKVPATAKEIDYTVPEDVGPPGDFYFIRYTAGANVFFSGSFSIANVNGAIAGFDPKNPNAKNATPSASPIPSPASPSTGSASNTDVTSSPAPTQDTNPTGSTQDPNATASGNTPASDSTTGAKSLPSELSSASNNLLPSFVGVATAAIALTLTYLY